MSIGIGESMNHYEGVNFNNLRKALYLLFFGVDNGNCNSFDSPKYKYIIPMQGNFENPLQIEDKDTYCLYWIEKDQSLTQDDFVEADSTGYTRQKCVATIMLRFVGSQAEDWAKSLRHLIKRDSVGKIWYKVLNAEKLEYTMPIRPERVFYTGRNGQIAFDIRFKLYYDEIMSTGWKPLEGIDFTVKGEITVEGNKNMEETV
jgi:hypothetical protein